MMRRTASGSWRHPRPGTAIVAALGLMMLAAALLASAALIAFTSTRSTRAAAAMLRAESIARRTASAALATWNPAYDSLPVGNAISTSVAGVRLPGTAGASTAATLRVQRLSATVYALSVDGQSGTVPLRARRRLRIFVQRVDAGSTTARVRRVTPLARWSSADLY